jgi:hypothetical protein
MPVGTAPAHRAGIAIQQRHQRRIDVVHPPGRIRGARIAAGLTWSAHLIPGQPERVEPDSDFGVFPPAGAPGPAAAEIDPPLDHRREDVLDPFRQSEFL